jgi:hypothetical protein
MMMSGDQQLYLLTVSARVRPGVEIQEKHKTFFEGIRGLKQPWGGQGTPPPPPSMTGQSLGVLDVTDFFGGVPVEAFILYRYRGNLPDSSMGDDRLNMLVPTVNIDLPYFIREVIPCFITAFGAYLCEYFDDQHFSLGIPQRTSNPRYAVDSVGPVSFYDALLCQRAFDLSPEQVADRVQGICEDVRLLQGGVYIIGSLRQSTFAESTDLCARLTAALTKNE